MRNWHTTLSWGITGLLWLLSHKTVIEPLMPPKYQGTANLFFVIGIAVSGALSKDAGNHAPAEGTPHV